MVLHMLISPIAVGRRHACHAIWAFRHVGASYMHTTCMQLRHALLHAPKGSFGCCVPQVCYEALISLGGEACQHAVTQAAHCRFSRGNADACSSFSHPCPCRM